MVVLFETDTKDDFDTALKSHGDKMVIVDFFADWCPPCKSIAPFLEQLESDNKEKVAVIKVNVDTCPTLAEELGIEAMPTFIFYKNGKKVDTVVGADRGKLSSIALSS